MYHEVRCVSMDTIVVAVCESLLPTGGTFVKFLNIVASVKILVWCTVTSWTFDYIV